MFSLKKALRQSIPHVRGGEPFAAASKSTAMVVFPTCVGVNRPGCAQVLEPCRVFPTCVGVNRNLRRRLRSLVRIPHVRGGEPSVSDA